MVFSGNLQNWNKYLCIIFEKVLTLDTARGKVSIVSGRKTFPLHRTDTALPVRERRIRLEKEVLYHEKAVCIIADHGNGPVSGRLRR